MGLVTYFISLNSYSMKIKKTKKTYKSFEGIFQTYTYGFWILRGGYLHLIKHSNNRDTHSIDSKYGVTEVFYSSRISFLKQSSDSSFSLSPLPSSRKITIPLKQQKSSYLDSSSLYKTLTEFPNCHYIVRILKSIVHLFN